jgi:ribonuclease HI
MKITLYTDGSSRGNPGPGGWAAILLTETEVIELGGYEDHTTNNRMELMGAIKGLTEIGPHMHVEEVEVCTDSEYVKKGITEWISGWMAKGWKNSLKKDVLNRDLWEALHKEEARLKDAGVKMKWSYVPGHAGVPLNERADVIATSCADSVMEKGATNLQLYRGPRADYEYF